MQAGTSWEGVTWRPTREISSIEVRHQRTIKATLLSFILLVSMFASLTFVWASSAEAVVCSVTSFNPKKVAAYQLRGGGRLNCRPEGSFRTLTVAVHRNINNFPDPRVCRAEQRGNNYPLRRSCKGTFRNAGNFYTYSTGGGGSDYSQFIYFRPG